MKSIFRHGYIWVLVLSTLALQSCGAFEKEVEIKMPPFESQLMVEAYIEDNKAIKVAVTETQDYYGELKLPFVDAEVQFIFNNQTYTLSKNPFFDLVNQKYFNYILKDSFRFQEGDIVYINVRDKNNRMVTAESRWINPVKLDSVKHAFKQNDTLALITAHFRDPGGSTNYYRFRVVNFSDSNRVVQDFFTEDGILNGQPTTLGTGYRFAKGDTLEVSLFSMPHDFYEFLETANAAAGANGNPFGQPAVIKSNVKGGTGIFTVLPYDRIIYIIP